MSDYDLQYRPLATVETATDDALSVRARDLARSVNNGVLVTAPRLCYSWPTPLSTGEFGTNTGVLVPIPGIEFGPGMYDIVVFQGWAVRTAGSGNSTLIFTVGSRPYRGADTEGSSTGDRDTMAPFNQANVTIGSGTDGAFAQQVFIPGRCHNQGYLFPLVSATNAASNDADLYCLSVTLWRSDA